MKGMIMVVLLVTGLGLFSTQAQQVYSQEGGFIPEEIQPLVQSWQNKGQKTAYLTFDDGPSLNTIPILDTLDRYGVKATFFVMGNGEPYADQAYKEMAARGHSVALHTYSHDYETVYGSKEGFFSDMHRLEEKLGKYGIKTKLVRFPGGSNNMAVQHSPKKEILGAIKQELEKRGYIYVDWHIDSEDGFSPNVSTQRILSNVLNRTEGKEQAVILLHDINSMKNTVKALPAIIKGLKESGYQFDVLTEYSPEIQFSK